MRLGVRLVGTVLASGNGRLRGACKIRDGRNDGAHNPVYLPAEEPSTLLLGSAVSFLQSPQNILLRVLKSYASPNSPGSGRAGNPSFFDREHRIFSIWPQACGTLSMGGC